MSFSIEYNGELKWTWTRWKEHSNGGGDDDDDSEQKNCTQNMASKAADWRGSEKETNKWAERLIDITSLFDDLLKFSVLKNKNKISECRYCIGIVSVADSFFSLLSSFSSMCFFFIIIFVLSQCTWVCMISDFALNRLYIWIIILPVSPTDFQPGYINVCIFDSLCSFCFFFLLRSVVCASIFVTFEFYFSLHILLLLVSKKKYTIIAMAKQC